MPNIGTKELQSGIYEYKHAIKVENIHDISFYAVQTFSLLSLECMD